MITEAGLKRLNDDFDWAEIRQQFRLDPAYIHLGASQFIATHPKIVREAIEHYRDELDHNPVMFILENEKAYRHEMRDVIATYMQHPNSDDIALTDSTTMGLGIIYTGLNVSEEHEILKTSYDHFSHQEAIRLAALRTGASVSEVSLYRNIHEVTQEEIVEAIVQGLNERTRVVGLTWVHSSTGLKLPITKIAKALRSINESRKQDKKILLVVDGVHGLGVEVETFPELGCDFFIAGTHKWTFGPRGTGFVAATSEAWQNVIPVIPSYTYVMEAVTTGKDRPQRMDGKQNSPGGFHSIEHRWAVREAFQFIERIGKERIYAHVHKLAHRCKQGLAAMPHVTLQTPMDDQLSAGIVAFEMDGFTTKELVDAIIRKKVIATESPYTKSYARFTPGIYNTEEDVDTALNVLDSLRK
jgi:isopenicillin-N epimerase